MSIIARLQRCSFTRVCSFIHRTSPSPNSYWNECWWITLSKESHCWRSCRTENSRRGWRTPCTVIGVTLTCCHMTHSPHVTWYCHSMSCDTKSDHMTLVCCHAILPTPFYLHLINFSPPLFCALILPIYFSLLHLLTFGIPFFPLHCSLWEYDFTVVMA